jgi:hypothetical protein
MTASLRDWRLFDLVYSEVVKTGLLAIALTLSTWALGPSDVPRFEDFTIDVFSGKSADPILRTSEERLYRTAIRQGVSKGWGAVDGTTGKELAAPGPNFAGHYDIVTWGCGSPCLMAAIVDLRTGRIFPPPFHHGPGNSYFQVPWAFPSKPLLYRVDSRLLVMNICEADKTVQHEGRVGHEAQGCGAHYFVMGDNGPELVHRIVAK